MARLSRLTLPGHPHHVIQRGNNRQAIFAATEDFQTMLDLLYENARKFAVAIHAYVLMTNHFHLLATPQSADALPQMMQAVGRRYVRYFNDAQGRSYVLAWGYPGQADLPLRDCPTPPKPTRSHGSTSPWSPPTP